MYQCFGGVKGLYILAVCKSDVLFSYFCQLKGLVKRVQTSTFIRSLNIDMFHCPH